MLVLCMKLRGNDTYNDEHGLLADDTKLGHRIHNTQKSVHGLGFLANHGLVDREREVVVVKVCLHVLAIDVENVQIHNSKAAAPALIAVGKVVVLGVKDSIEEREVILDLFVTFDVEAVLRLNDGSLKV